MFSSFEMGPGNKFYVFVLSAALVCAGCGAPPTNENPKVSLQTSQARQTVVVARGDSGSPFQMPAPVSAPSQSAVDTASVSPTPDRAAPATTSTSSSQCTADALLMFNRPTRPSRSMPLMLLANPQSIAAGQSTTLTWTSQNTTSVTIDHGVGTFGASGSVIVSPTQTTEYTATATGPGGSVTQRVTVGVSGNLSLNASANSPRITRGQPATLSWTTANATSV